MTLLNFLGQKPRFHKKFSLETFFSQFVLCLTSNTSQNIGGTDDWAVPPVQLFRGGASPQSSLSLRPCSAYTLHPPKRSLPILLFATNVQFPFSNIRFW